MLYRPLAPTCFALTLSITSLAHSEIQRVAAHNFGDLEYRAGGGVIVHSTNTDNPPYDGTGGIGWLQMQSWSPDYQMDGVAEFRLADITPASSYYLEISPTSTFFGVGIPETVTIFASHGDGVLTFGDWGAGNSVGSVAVTDPNLVSWYWGNGIGGFTGDSYLDLTSVVSQALESGWDFLSLRYRGDGTGTALSLRAPVLLATSNPIPTPSAFALLALGGFASRRRRGSNAHDRCPLRSRIHLLIRLPLF